MKSLIAVITMLAVGAASAAAQPGETKERLRSVTVRGMGSLATVPDQLRLSVQVSTRASSASEAMTQASLKTREILAILTKYGVETKDIQTSRVTVSPIVDYQRNIQPPPIVGYNGINEFHIGFKGKLMDKVGEFMDRAVTAGASSFGGLHYESSAQRELEREALRKAAADARARAEVLAKELGATAGKVISISESVSMPVPLGRGAMADVASGSVPAPVLTGELTITAYVDVVFELR